MSDTPIPLHDAREGEPAELAALRQRSVMSFPAEMHETVRETVAAVRERGDEALVEHTRRLDWPDATAEQLAVPAEELHSAYDRVEAGWVEALRTATSVSFRCQLMLETGAAPTQHHPVPPARGFRAARAGDTRPIALPREVRH